MTMKTMAIGLIGVLAIGCATAPKTSQERKNLVAQAQAALDQMTMGHEDLNQTLQTSYGYAIFPSVGAGGLVVGGSHGQGVVYEHGSLIGYGSISSVSAGAQAGGETYSELIAFQDKDALNRMLNNKLSLTATASAVALKPGVAAKAQFQDGLAVFVQPTGGAMVDVSVGGQKFSYVPAGAPLGCGNVALALPGSDGFRTVLHRSIEVFPQNHDLS